jgi:hypothetical protein
MNAHKSFGSDPKGRSLLQVNMANIRGQEVDVTDKEYERAFNIYWMLKLSEAIKAGYKMKDIVTQNIEHWTGPKGNGQDTNIKYPVRY